MKKRLFHDNCFNSSRFVFLQSHSNLDGLKTFQVLMAQKCKHFCCAQDTKNFGSQILNILKRIPKGKVTTYKLLGEALNSRAYRAIGQILKRNKCPDKIPCFKVVKSNGEIGGYCGSSEKNIKKKIEKLREEGIEVIGDKIDLKKYLFRF